MSSATIIIALFAGFIGGILFQVIIQKMKECKACMLLLEKCIDNEEEVR